SGRRALTRDTTSRNGGERCPNGNAAETAFLFGGKSRRSKKDPEGLLAHREDVGQNPARRPGSSWSKRIMAIKTMTTWISVLFVAGSAGGVGCYGAPQETVGGDGAARAGGRDAASSVSPTSNDGGIGPTDDDAGESSGPRDGGSGDAGPKDSG